MKTVLSCLIGVLALCSIGFMLKMAFFSSPKQQKQEPPKKEVVAVVHSTEPQRLERLARSAEVDTERVNAQYNASLMDALRTPNSAYLMQDETIPIIGQPAQETPVQVKQGYDKVSFNDSSIRYTGYDTDGAYDGGNCVILFFEYSNNANESRDYFLSGMDICAYQNGAKLEATRPANVWYSEIANDATSIGKGETISFARVHKLVSNDPITVQIKDRYSGDVTLYQFDVELR